MAKQRYIDTRFWMDGFIRKLDFKSAHLFLYFLTNDKTNISGCYELPLETIIFETKFKKREIENSLEKIKSRIIFVDGWIFIKNFLKYQKINNPKIKKGISSEYSKFPAQIKDKIIALDSSYKSYIRAIDELSRAIDELSHSNSNSNSNSNFNSNSAPRKKINSNTNLF